MNVLLVPSNSNQAKMFVRISDFIVRKSGKISAICLDTYKGENSENTLKNGKIAYKKIEEYDTHDLVKVLIKEKADLVVVGNDMDPIEKSFVFAANYLGLPVILVQDGLITQAAVSSNAPLRIAKQIKELPKWLRMYRFFIENSVITSKNPLSVPKNLYRDILNKAVYTHTYGSTDFTKIAVIGNHAKKIFIRQGIPEEKIVVTGQPMFDGLYARKFDSKEFRTQLDCTFTKKIVTFCTQPFVEYKFWTKEKRKLLLSTLINAFQKLPDVQLVIKLHPVEKIDDYKQILAEIDVKGKTKNQVLLFKDIDLYELINVSDIIMTVYSTVALEAMILGKPIVIVDFSKGVDKNPYLSGGAASGACNSDEIVHSIQNLLYNQEEQLMFKKKMALFVHEQVYKIDGKASQRIADLILKTIQESQRK